MSALSVRVERQQVGTVGLTPAAHHNVRPLPAGTAADDGERAVDGDPLGFMACESVPVVDVAIVEVPGRQEPRFGFTVELDGQRSCLGVDVDRGGEVAIEDSESGIVLEADHSVSALVFTSASFEG